MSKKSLLLLAVCGWLAVLVAAGWEHAPGYMDADYYAVTGLGLAQSGRLQQSFLWNYLDDPAGLPHPSHAYWMPLATFWAAAGAWLSRRFDFFGARLGFVLLAGLIPPLTAQCGWLLSRRRRVAWLAGGLAVFPAFYLPYLPTTDTFAISMILGGLFFLFLQPRRPFLLGLLAGLMFLSRVDGMLWLFVALLVVWRSRPGWRQMGSVLTGFVLPALPWMARDLRVFGTPFSPGGGRALWMTAYNQLYAFPASQLDAQHWLASGAGAILSVRWQALWSNLASLLAVQGMIFLFPWLVWGAWHMRRDRRVQLFLLVWVGILALMSLVFPFAGVRGGYFHSGAAFQPLFWALAAAGLDAMIVWGSEKRNWQAGSAWRVLGGGFLLAALALSGLVFSRRVIGPQPEQPLWDAGWQAYRSAGVQLQARNLSPDARILVNNPPGFTLSTGFASLAVPDGGPDSLLAVAAHYQAGYLLLEANHPPGLDNLFDHPSDRPGLKFLGQVPGGYLFKVESGTP